MKSIHIRTLATLVMLALVALGLKALTLTAGDASMTDLLLNGARQLSQARVRNLYL